MSDQNKTTQKRRIFSHQKMGLTHKHGGFKPQKKGLNRIQSWNIMNITHFSMAYWIRCHSSPGNLEFRMIELWLNYWITMELYTCKYLLLAKGTACRKPNRFWRSNRGVKPVDLPSVQLWGPKHGWIFPINSQWNKEGISHSKGRGLLPFRPFNSRKIKESCFTPNSSNWLALWILY